MPRKPSETIDNQSDAVDQLIRNGFDKRQLLMLLLGGSVEAGACCLTLDYFPHLAVLQCHDDGHIPGFLEGATSAYEQIQGGNPSSSIRGRSRLLAVMLASVSSEMSVAGETVVHDARGIVTSPQTGALGTRQGTRLICHLSAAYTWQTCESLREDLESVSDGSPLPVIFNGEVIHRPSALSEGKHEEGLYAHYHMRDHGTGQLKFFLEGLPVKLPNITLPALSGADCSIHLKPGEFATLFPGCGIGVCDPITANLLEHEIQHRFRRVLARKAAMMDPSTFVLEHSTDCLALGADHLIEGLPLHPSLWGRYDQLPSPATLPVQAIPQDILPATQHLMDDVPWHFGEMMSLAACYIYSLGWPVLKERVPIGHWASRQALSPATIPLRITDHELIDKRIITEGLLKDVTVRVCERFTLSPSCGRAPTVESREAPAFCDDTRTLYLTAGSMKHLHALLLQLDCYGRNPKGVAKLHLHRDYLKLRHLLAETLTGRETAWGEAAETL
jgi:hypothetical protein